MPEYKIVVPQKEKKREYWNTAIGLQQVDELEPSQYLIELSEKTHWYVPTILIMFEELKAQMII